MIPQTLMMQRFTKIFAVGMALMILGPLSGIGAPKWADLDRPEHDYWNRPLNDKFTQLKDQLETGKLPLDYRTEKTFLVSLLKALDIPASSQVMVFSTTSLQLRLINVRNPRAIYFNEDIYIGYIPGGRIEVVALHPELGGIFYIFDIPRGRKTVRVERSTRCMNCHADEDTGNVPGLLAKSVISGPNGGSLRAFRIGKSGHGIPYSERFGGWHVTGQGSLTNHHGNLTGRYSNGKLLTFPAEPGRKFVWSKYATRTSDMLAHLVFEHQIGFVNRVLEAGYRTRSYLREDQGKLTAEHDEALTEQADLLVRYILFADEPNLPADGLRGDDTFKQDFQAAGKADGELAALREFDLKTRMFKYRCSYMIGSSVFTGLPDEMKRRIFVRLRKALSTDAPDALYDYLSEEEKCVIRELLAKGLAGFRTS